MSYRKALTATGLALVAVLAVSVGAVLGQGPTIDSESARSPGSDSSTLGRAPGSGAESPLGAQGAGDTILGGRPGASTPRVPTSISTPAGGTGAEDMGIELPQALSQTKPPILGSLAIPKLIDGGDPGGMTLEEAIERVLRDNLELRAQFIEIPQADADILTASLRANPIFYADAQLVPYGKYTDRRPGGQTQYDVNISLPLDVTHKRRARTIVARQAKKVVEAQFQDAARLQIDNVHVAYVDLLAARGAVRFSEVGVAGLEEAYKTVQSLQKRGERNAADVRRVRIQLDNARLGLVDTQETYRRAKRTLGQLLGMSPEESEVIEPRAALLNAPIELPPTDELMRTALQFRPDVNAFRLGLSRAEAEVGLARANRMSDVYLLVQPYTFQNNSSIGEKSATSYAVGLTVPLPIHNRNQGNIQRAKLNVSKTQLQLAGIEPILTEVRQAEEEFKLSRSTVEKLETTVNPAAERVLEDSERLFRGGEINLLDYLNARGQYNEVARRYLDTLVRYRRSMLNLNTVLGQRFLP